MILENDEKDEKSYLMSQLVGVDQLYVNVSQQVIITTEDKIKLCLNKHIKLAEKRREWVAPFTLMIAIITIFITSTFKSFLFSSETWQAIFTIIGLGSLIWFGMTIKNAFKKINIDIIIYEMKLGDKTRSLSSESKLGDTK